MWFVFVSAIKWVAAVSFSRGEFITYYQTRIKPTLHLPRGPSHNTINVSEQAI